jgi:hypothetical protein
MPDGVTISDLDRRVGAQGRALHGGDGKEPKEALYRGMAASHSEGHGLHAALQIEGPSAAPRICRSAARPWRSTSTKRCGRSTRPQVRSPEVPAKDRRTATSRPSTSLPANSKSSTDSPASRRSRSIRVCICGPRNARGRVPGRDPQPRSLLGSDVALLNKYVSRGARPGRLRKKSGWLKALQLVGGDAPAYVTKQGTGGGEVIDDHANEDNPSITAINRTPWAVRKDEGGRILADAKASRINAIITKTRLAAIRADEEAKAS